MRILYVTSVDPSVADGPGVNEREFLRAMQRHHAVEVDAILPTPAAPWPEDLDADRVVFTYERHMRHPVRALRHQYSQGRAIRRALRSAAYDLAVIRLYPFPMAVAATVPRSGLPYVLKHLGPKLVDVVDQQVARPLRVLAWLNRTVLERLLAGALLGETVSERQRQAVAARFPGMAARLRVVDNAVNTERFRPCERHVARARTGLDRFDPIIGYAGNYPALRGGMQIVEALPSLRRRFPRIGGLVLGGGDEERVRARASELGVSDICTITGRVAFECVPDYIAALDVGVSLLEPEESGASEQKIRQYLAAGRPVVTTPGTSAFVADIGAGSVVAFNDQGAFEEAVTGWLTADAGKWEQASARARDYAVGELSVERSIETRLQMWSAALEHRRSADA